MAKKRQPPQQGVNQPSAPQTQAVSPPIPPASPVSPPPPYSPASTPSVPSPLDEQKKALEIAKLEEELANLRKSRNWFWTSVRGVKLSEWITASAAVIALGVAVWTGLFNAIREKLSSQADRLAVEKIDLEQRKEKLASEIADKEKELAGVKSRLTPFEQEESALRELRGLKKEGLKIDFTVTAEMEGMRISIMHNDISWMLGLADESVSIEKPTTRRRSSVGKGISAVNKLRSVKGLRLIELELNRDDVAAATERDDLEVLLLEFARLDRATLARIRSPRNLTSLSLRGNAIIDLAGLPSLETVQFLDLSDNPLGDEALAAIPSVFPKVKTLMLNGTGITAGAIGHLKKIPGLTHLSVQRTELKGTALEKLVEVPMLNSVAVSKGQIPPETKTKLQERAGTGPPIYVTETNIVRALLGVDW